MRYFRCEARFAARSGGWPALIFTALCQFVTPKISRASNGRKDPFKMKSMRLYTEIGRLLAGNGAAHAIQLSALLILSRLCSPGEFGSLALVQTLGTIAASILTLQLHCTVPLKKADQSARSAVFMTQAITLLASVLVFPVLTIGQGWVGLSAALLAVLIGLGNTYVAYLTSRGDFAKLAKFLVSRAIMIASAQVLLATLGASWALILGTLIGEGLASTYLRLSSLGPVRSREFKFREALAYAATNRSFSIFGTAQEITSIALLSAPLLAFAWTYSEGHAGQYSMASRLIWAPTTLLSTNIARVLTYRYNLHLPRVFGDIYEKRVVVLGVLLALIGYMVTDNFPEIVMVMIGRKWELASRIIPIQIIWSTVFLFAIPLRVLCRNLELQPLQFFIELAALITIACAAIFLRKGALFFMWAIVGIALAQLGLYMLLISRELRSRGFHGLNRGGERDRSGA